MKHRLAEESRTERDSVEASGKRTFKPNLDGMSVSFLEKLDVATFNVPCDPGLPPEGAPPQNASEIMIDPDFPIRVPEGPAKTMRCVEFIQRKNSPWVRGVPFDITLRGAHREDSRGICFKQEPCK